MPIHPPQGPPPAPAEQVAPTPSSPPKKSSGLLPCLTVLFLLFAGFYLLTQGVSASGQPPAAVVPTSTVPPTPTYIVEDWSNPVTPSPIRPEEDRQVTTVQVDTNYTPTGTQPADCGINTRWPQSIKQWCGWLTYYARLNGYDPDWAAAQMWQESGGNPNAQSNKCATGLIQVMPSDGKLTSATNSGYCDLTNGTNANYKEYYSGVFRNRPTIAQLRDPEYNLSWGLNYMGNLIKSHGSIWDALLYYGGVGYGDRYRGAVKIHYDCVVSQIKASCTGGLSSGLP